MKLKKIKNYILTFIICLLGAFAFNVIETKAYTLYDNFSVNENVVYSTYDDVRHLYLYGRDSSNMSVYYYNTDSYSYIFYPTCSYDSIFHSISCTGNRVSGNFGSNSNINQNNLTLLLIKGDNVISDRISAEWADGDSHLFSEINSYQNGYFTGYEEGKEDGSHEGYDLGYTEGYDLGYNLGYTEGYDTSETSRNSLVGMVGAIFTGPVTMFQQIFNFNFLGINFAEMLLGLVTLLVVIWLIKKFI